MSVTCTDKVYVYVSGAWSDITGDVVETISARWGISGNQPGDRLADTGEMRFRLSNDAGIYSPDLAGALAGFGKGTPVKLVITYDGSDYVRFRGVIDKLDIQSGTFGGQRVTVTAVDWMEYAANYPMQSPGAISNLRAGDAVKIITENVPVQPQAKELDAGDNVFPAVFDIVTRTTRAYSEYSKLALSELGYIYLKKDGYNGETLVFESATRRNGTDRPTKIPKTKAASGYLLKEDGGKLLLETGGGILLNQTEDVDFDNSMVRLSVQYGNHLANRFTSVAYPRKIDSSLQVLFNLDRPIRINPDEVIQFRANYADPLGGATVNGVNMLPPVVNVDYKMWELENSTGTDLTSYLTVVADYGVDGVTYTLTNTSTYQAYVTQLRARGYGVYTYNPIESTKENKASIDQYGYYSETLHQKYQQTLDKAIVETERYLEQNSQPRTVLNKIYLVANRSNALMMAFLTFDVGSLVHITEDKTGIDGYYYIQGVDFTVQPGGLIKYAWTVKETISLGSGLTMVGADFGAGASSINFGYLPQVIHHPKRTISFWAYAYNYIVDGLLFGLYGANSGFETYLNSSGNIVYFFRSNGGLVSHKSNSAIGEDVWVHVVITSDTEVYPFRGFAPVIYFDGSATGVTAVDANTITNPYGNEIGAQVKFGMNIIQNFFGILKDVRIYDRILTSAEITALYNSGTPDVDAVPDGLVFQAPCVKTKDLAYWSDRTMTADDRVVDNVYGAAGIPAGEPIIRTT